MAKAAETGARAPLHRDAIVAEAIAMADEAGLGGLTMRKLAGRLGYEVMSLYNHVANKGELLALMVDAVAAEIGDPDPSLDPLPAVRDLAVRTHDVLRSHPWAPAIWQRHLPGPARTAQMEHLLALLDASGLSPQIAHHGFHAVTNHVLGYTLQELGMDMGDDPEARVQAFLDRTPAETYPHMVAHVHQHLEGDTAPSFELVLDLILDGLVRLDSET